jgi:hypothetical protein
MYDLILTLQRRLTGRVEEGGGYITSSVVSPVNRRTEALQGVPANLSRAQPELKYHIKNINIVCRLNKPGDIYIYTLDLCGQRVQKTTDLPIATKYI